MAARKKVDFRWYLFVIANLLPVMGMFGGIWRGNQIAYFYWAECALVAVLALAMYAKYLLVFFIMTLAVGFIVYLANPLLFEHRDPILAFWCLYGLCWLFYVELRRSTYGQKIRKLKPGPQLAIYLSYMLAAIGLCWLITTAVAGSIAQEDSPVFYQTFIAMAVLVPAISMAMIKIVDMIGQQHFIDFIKGTYQEPTKINSVVLFLDMVGSSGMAEKLDPVKSMNLIASFIYDCGYIFRIHSGDILNYTGDGLVVIWPRHKANNALAAVHKLRGHFSSKPVRTRYWRDFGMSPDFRIGLHAGPVVISQVGEEKLFLGLYGDVVNTASRLEQLNKTLKTNVLLSADVAKTLNQSWRALLKPMGEQEIRGRAQKVPVFTLYGEV